MKITRGTVFETNSSSMHTLCLNKEPVRPEDIPDYKGGECTIELCEFGWSGSCSQWDEKVAYLFTFIFYMIPESKVGDATLWFYDTKKEFDSAVKLVKKTDDYKRIEEIVLETINASSLNFAGTGYIDHQSYESYKSLDEWLEHNDIHTDEDLKTFIFGKSCIDISNDNEWHD